MNDDKQNLLRSPVRRRLMLTVGAGCALAACGGGDSTLDGANGDATPDTGTDDTMPTDATDDAPTCTDGPAIVGLLTDFQQGTWTLTSDASGAVVVIVGWDANGLFAYSGICTHERCVVGNPNRVGTTTCPCHLSRFDGNGNVLQGPATRPLRHYALTICNGNVSVDTSLAVSSSTRTPPP